MEPGIQTCEETLTLGSGSCRDSAWLLVQLLRHLGLAARFVSGYLIQLMADVKPLDGPSGPEADFTDLHAWAEVYLPGRRLGRPRPDLGPARRRGAHPARLRGRPAQRRARSPARSPGPRTRRGEDDDVRARVHASTWRCTRIHEDPARHQAVHRGAVAGDRRARPPDRRAAPGRRRPADDGRRADVRLDRRPDGAEWNTDRAGPDEAAAGRRAARAAARPVRAGRRCSTYGQGKWYPGESLPRWAFGCYWRRDGVPSGTTPA